jgi:hypothetical protein
MDPRLLDLIYRIINLFVVLITIFILFFPFYINLKLLKSRGRSSEKKIWLFLTIIFSWISTLVLAAMKPVDKDNGD